MAPQYQRAAVASCPPIPEPEDRATGNRNVAGREEKESYLAWQPQKKVVADDRPEKVRRWQRSHWQGYDKLHP